MSDDAPRGYRDEIVSALLISDKEIKSLRDQLAKARTEAALITTGNKKLRDEVKMARYRQSQSEASCHILQAKIDAMKDTDIEDDLDKANKRIEELEKESKWNAMKQLLCADYHIITNAEIDAAWEYAHKYAGNEAFGETVLYKLNIVACGECDGACGHDGGQGQGISWTRCHGGCAKFTGHGWIRKERGDE